MIPPTIEKEIITLAKSFCITIVTAAIIAGAQWAGAHIPQLLSYLGTLAVSYGSMKHYS